ncbi:hypothetical protein [Brevundimonas diminuta]|jgi:ribosome-associated translation inhibitor RaiA|uniref:hypothetical protein n=1 Tax=Brevundimonas diminuta TaxID=293 RepID=UPI001F57D3B0|nr:hypothetical protein [Brevundimonas diminuta]
MTRTTKPPKLPPRATIHSTPDQVRASPTINFKAKKGSTKGGNRATIERLHVERKPRKHPNRMRHNAKDDLLDLSSSLVKTLRHAVAVSADAHGQEKHWTDEYEAIRAMLNDEIERTYGPLPAQVRELTKLVDDWREKHGIVSEWTVYALLHLSIRYACAAPTAVEALIPFNVAISKLTRRIKRAKERIDDHWSNAAGVTTPLPWC